MFRSMSKFLQDLSAAEQVLFPEHSVRKTWYYARRRQLCWCRVFPAVCLLFFADNISKTDEDRITKLVICSLMSPNNPLYFFVKKVKGQVHTVCVGLQTERNNAAAAAYVNNAGISLLHWPTASNASDTGFSCVTSPRPLAAGRWVFSGVGFALTSQCRIFSVVSVIFNWNNTERRVGTFHAPSVRCPRDSGTQWSRQVNTVRQSQMDSQTTNVR